MANFSKYFNEAVKSRSCSDFFHPGISCTEAKIDLIPKLLAGSTKYFLPVLLIPSLAKFEWSKEYFKEQLVLSVKAVLGGFVPAFVTITTFCGFFDYLKKHYLQFYGIPVALGIMMATLTLPKHSINILAAGGVNHLIELILEASKETLLYELKGNLMLGSLLFMTLSSSIVYLYKTSPHRPFWLLHVPHRKTPAGNVGNQCQKAGWMDFIIRRKRKICEHQEDSCEEFLWQELKKVSKIGFLISMAKSIISGYSEIKSGSLLNIPGILLKHMDIRSLLFLPGYCGSFKLINCLLNRLFYEDTTKNSLMAGFLSGSFYMFYPNFTLISFAFIRTVQLLWLKHIKGSKRDDKVMRRLKSLPMGMIVLWSSATILFISRILHPHTASKYISVCLNFLTGSFADSVITNYYGILMGLQ